MDRRVALKNMGLALGYTVATPTLISIVQSCQTEKVVDWTPDFFSKEEGSVVTHLVDIILPKTDTPAASEVNVHLFIDRYLDQVVPTEQLDFIKMTLGQFIEKSLATSGKENAMALTAEDLEPVLASTLKINKEEEEANEEVIGAYMEASAKGEAAELNADVGSSVFASTIREVTIWGYKTSEYIGEEVLAYLPVPGEYIGCGDLEELTGGKAWSI